MTRYVLLSIFVLALAVLGLVLRGEGFARGDAATTVVLSVGDTMRVRDAPIGCQVTRRNDRVTIDCRRAGRLAGSYGTLFDARRVRVARFRSSDTAKVVFKATHRGRARRCDDARASRQARR